MWCCVFVCVDVSFCLFVFRCGGTGPARPFATLWCSRFEFSCTRFGLPPFKLLTDGRNEQKLKQRRGAGNCIQEKGCAHLAKMQNLKSLNTGDHNGTAFTLARCLPRHAFPCRSRKFDDVPVMVPMMRSSLASNDTFLGWLQAEEWISARNRKSMGPEISPPGETYLFSTLTPWITH